MDERYQLIAEASSAQAYEVKSAIACRFLACYYGRNILAKAAATLYHHITANLAELMAENGRTNDGIVVNYNLTSEFCSVADDNVTAENAVVSNVHALHEQVVVAHNCCAFGCGTTRW